MVRPFVPTEPKEEEDVEMPPADKAAPDVDFGSAEGESPPPQPRPRPEPDIRYNWQFPAWETQAEWLKENLRQPGVHPIDPICICCKTNPIPMKDLDPSFLQKRTDAWYGGHSICEGLMRQEHQAIVNDKVIRVSRWAAIFLDENSVSYTHLTLPTICSV